MTKRNSRKYGLLNFYQQDLFGELVIKDFLRTIPNKNYKKEMWIFKNKLNKFKPKYLVFNNKIAMRRSTKYVPKPRKEVQIGSITKKIKINRKLLQETLEYTKRRFYSQKNKKRQKFYYRVDLGKPKKKRKKLTKFAARLLMRHKVRLFASQMNVQQFRSYLKKAVRFNKLFHAFNKLLEFRLDFFLKRINFVPLARENRQFINHGNIIINGLICNKPSKKLSPFDLVSVLNKQYLYKIKSYRSKYNYRFFFSNIPKYIEVNFRILTGLILYIPSSKEVPLFPYINSNYTVSSGKRAKN